jgi:diguanylate cyclase (GGDEF)-like protein
VLRALATELRQQVRESDVVGRFGGEEFTVLLPRTDGAGRDQVRIYAHATGNATENKDEATDACP